MSDDLDFDVPTTRKVPAADKIPFRINGAEFKLQPPKTATLGMMLLSMDRADELVAAGRAREAAGDTFRAVQQLLRHVEQPGRAVIEARLSDPDDGLDIENLMPILRALLESVGGARPTKRRPASSGRRTASGRTSRARTR